MKSQIINFRDCKLQQLEKLFSLKPLPVKEMPILLAWLEAQSELTDHEHEHLLILQSYLEENVDAWNEQELTMHFIGPMFTLVGFNYHRQFNLFAERPLSGKVDGVEMGGKPDGVIATGYREPEKPYFCFQEYKKSKDPEGDPEAQVLAAMLVAQEINEGQFPIYGCFVHGRYWRFMVLQGKDYTTSDAYVATKAEIFDILRILKVLKAMIIERVISQ